MVNKKYVHFNDYLKTERNIDNLKNLGIKRIFKKNKLKMYLGLTFLTIALIPNGLGIPCYTLAFICLGIRKVDIFHLKEKGIRKLKNKWKFK